MKNSNAGKGLGLSNLQRLRTHSVAANHLGSPEPWTCASAPRDVFFCCNSCSWIQYAFLLNKGVGPLHLQHWQIEALASLHCGWREAFGALAITLCQLLIHCNTKSPCPGNSLGASAWPHTLPLLTMLAGCSRSCLTIPSHPPQKSAFAPQTSCFLPRSPKNSGNSCTSQRGISSPLRFLHYYECLKQPQSDLMAADFHRISSGVLELSPS